MKSQERFPYPRPPVRPLKIYAFDPMVGLDRRTRVSVETRNEPLEPGPLGARIAVVDYDPTFDCFYTPVDLDDQAILMQGGLDPSEGDPRFHQQMVYAVSSRILEIFDRALGRPVDLAGSENGGKPRPLRLFPHALTKPNAFYSPRLGAIMFGYFHASQTDVGANIPGQIIFSCLSHDVIAHELTHALINAISPGLIQSAHLDTSALHEGLADLVAILHRFSLESVVRDEIRRTRGKLDVFSPLCQVAAQFGAGMGAGMHGLRNARTPATPEQYSKELEPHSRGALLISAILEALFSAYNAAVKDLMDIAASSGMPAEGDLHPDLVNRLAMELSRLAQSLLTMCIRAFDYLPPVDVSFGDFLRSAVTADWELSPDDSSGMRTALIESFHSRGIYATGARSLAEESLIWESPVMQPEPLPAPVVAALTENAQSFGRIRPGEGERTSTVQDAKQELARYARRNARALNLWGGRRLEVVGGTRYCFRVGADGQLSIDIVAKFQESRRRGARKEHRSTTLVASADGTVRYVINNQPVPDFLHVENGALALKEPSPPPRPSADAPFPPRYRLDYAQYKSRSPRLVPTRKEINDIKKELSGSL